MDCILPGSSVQGIFQTRILEWIAISFSKGSSRPEDGTHFSCISCMGRHVSWHWAMKETQQESWAAYNNRNVFFSSGGWRFKVWMPAWLGSGEDLLSGCRLSTSACILTWLKEGENALWAGFSVSSVQLISSVWLFVTPWTTPCQASLSITKSWSLHKLRSIESVMPSNHLILCRPLLLLPSIFPSTRVFSNESAFHIRWPKYWGFSFSISPSNEHPGLISFRMDWLDLLAVQETLKSLLQHHSLKASILQLSTFFTVQL